jgi:hypothetical protein
MSERTVPHLSDVLTAGALPAAEPDSWIVEKFAEALEVLERGRNPVEWVQKMRTYFVWDDILDDRTRAVYWSTDLVECPELVPLMWDALDPFAAAELALLLDWSAHPYPMLVGAGDEGPNPGGRWSCCSCGADKFDDDVALVITGRPGYSDDLECPITYCRDCVQMAAAAMAGGS